MTWKKHFKTVNSSLNSVPTDIWNSKGSTAKFSSMLPEIYAGHPNRIQRYYQYEDMGRDSDISAALDTIADFCTQSEEQNDEPFLINWLEDPSDTQVKVIKQALKQWVKANRFKSKLWKMVRDCAQFGDAFFIRDPEDHTWIWIDHFSVEVVKMKQDGKQEPEEYVVKNFNPHITQRFGTGIDDMAKYRTPGMVQPSSGRPMMAGGGAAQFQIAGSDRDTRNINGMGAKITTHVAVDANNMVHLSLNEQMDVNFPFGKSLLDPVFKTYKQKEMLEDSILIYRVQRAPERRVFYIDVGGMNGVRAQAYIEGIKNEIHQRRIPNRSGGGSVLDATYSPMAILDDYFFAQCLSLNTKIPLLDGRTLTLQEIIDEHKAGITNYVYSMNKTTFEMEAAKVTWADVTRRNAEVLRVTLDNGEYVDATPDHPFIMRDGREVEAQHLAEGDSLMPLILNGEEITISVASVVKLDDREDTGDITVSGPTDSHVFAVEAGIYVHNSPEGRGSKVEVLPSGDCLALDTMIPLLDGRELSLADIITEHAAGKQHWVYSCDPKTGEVVPGMVNWAGTTRLDTEVCRITLDNGQTIVTTLDHKFPTLARGTVEAKNLQPNDSLIPFNTRKEKIKNIGNTYTQVYDNYTKGWKYVHKMVAEYFTDHDVIKEITFDQYDDTTKSEVHHIDFNRNNNSPENLSRTVDENFGNLTKEGVKHFFEKMSPDEYEAHCEGISDRIREAIAQKNPEEREQFRAKAVTHFKKAIEKCHRLVDGWKQFKNEIALANAVVSVEILPDRIDTGTLTIDGSEIYHNFHTFALSSGVFTFNSLGEITDLSYFTKKMARGLRIPTSYLSLSDDDQPAAFNDGKLGQAMIQEYRFNKFCMRIQGFLAPVFDKFFKEFLGQAGIQFEENMFELMFNPPQNFTKYRQIELDLQQTQVYSSVAGNKVLSERFKLKRYLNLTEEEILDNESLWKEENPDRMIESTGATAADTSQEGDLGSVGFGGSSDFDLAPMDDAGMDDMGGDAPADTPDLTLPPTGPVGPVGTPTGDDA